MSDTKKTLLNEATIRRFMKLGGLKPLTETFFDKNETIEEEVEETIEEEVEELDEMGHEAGDRDEEPEMGEPEMGEPEMGEPEMDEPELELDEPAEEALVSDEQAEEILAAVADALGVDATIASADDAAPMDDMAAEEPMMETTDEETVTEETDTDEETVTEETDTNEVDESLVAEIARRVAARLDGASKRENLAEKLAERIFNKLSKKG